MKKLIILLLVSTLVVSSAFPRGGNWQTIPLYNSTGSVVLPLTSTSYERYIWNISTNQNSCLKITYNIRLGEGDFFAIYSDESKTHPLVEINCSGSEDQTFFGEVYTTNANGMACVELEIMMRPSNQIDDYICFSYQPSPSFSCNDLIASGDVGIGTDQPLYELDVRGTIRANEIIVDIPTGADFVFETGYSLMPLSELSAYVRMNHHLPEIQSAAEMQTEGVSVSDMQTRLLQKIEELTLYILQQQELINSLQQEVLKLKK